MKATVSSGMMYSAKIKNETEPIKFIVDDDGTFWTWDVNNSAKMIPAYKIRLMEEIKPIYDDFTFDIDNGVNLLWDDIMFKHNGDYFTREDAIEEIKDDDDLFKEYVDENATCIDIGNHSYYTDYDTISDWGILDDIREDWNDEIERLIDNDYFNDWETAGILFNNVKYIILDSGMVIDSDSIDKDMVSELINIVMESCETDNRIGDWIVTRAPTEINEVNTNTTTPTINPDSERPISLT